MADRSSDTHRKATKPQTDDIRRTRANSNPPPPAIHLAEPIDHLVLPVPGFGDTLQLLANVAGEPPEQQRVVVHRLSDCQHLAFSVALDNHRPAQVETNIDLNLTTVIRFGRPTLHFVNPSLLERGTPRSGRTLLRTSHLRPSSIPLDPTEISVSRRCPVTRKRRGAPLSHRIQTRTGLYSQAAVPGIPRPAMNLQPRSISCLHFERYYCEAHCFSHRLVYSSNSSYPRDLYLERITWPLTHERPFLKAM